MFVIPGLIVCTSIQCFLGSFERPKRSFKFFQRSQIQ